MSGSVAVRNRLKVHVVKDDAEAFRKSSGALPTPINSTRGAFAEVKL